MKYYIYLLVFLLSQPCLGIDNKHTYIKTFEYKFIQILDDLDSIIINSKNQNNIVAEHYNFIKSKIQNNDLAITYDSLATYDFYDCASFNVSKNNTSVVSISFGPFLADKYKDYPALIHAIIVNTFQSAYDYYNNHHLFLISDANPIERTYFEIDAASLEALFLSTYIKDFQKVGPVENYLIADLKNNMSGTATLFFKTDLDLLHNIDAIKSGDGNAEQLLNKFNDIGKDLIKRTSFNSKDKWKNYCSIVTLKTYVFYSEQVIYDIVHLKKGINHDSFDILNYPENMKTIKNIQNIIKDNIGFLSHHQEIIQKLSEYYK